MSKPIRRPPRSRRKRKPPAKAKRKVIIPIWGLTIQQIPVFPELKRLLGYIPLLVIPEDMNREPNVRVPYLGTSAYRSMSKNMLGEGLAIPNSFHIACIGLYYTTTKARVAPGRAAVRKVEVANYGYYNGLVNGGNVYETALKNKAKAAKLIEEGEDLQVYIPIQIIEGPEEELVRYMAEGLNRNIQVPNSALLNADGVFDPIKEVLESVDILKFFECMGNERKADPTKQYPIGWSVKLLDAMSVHRYPLYSARHPCGNFGSPGGLISRFGTSLRNEFDGLLHLLPQLWQLYEKIMFEGPSMLRYPVKKRPSFVRPPKKGSKMHVFPVIGETSGLSVTTAAAGAVLSSFRHYVSVDSKTGLYSWDPSFDKVLEVWKTFGPNLMKVLHQYIGVEDASTKGKQIALWEMLHDSMDKIKRGLTKPLYAKKKNTRPPDSPSTSV